MSTFHSFLLYFCHSSDIYPREVASSVVSWLKELEKQYLQNDMQFFGSLSFGNMVYFYFNKDWEPFSKLQPLEANYNHVNRRIIRNKIYFSFLWKLSSSRITYFDTEDIIKIFLESSSSSSKINETYSIHCVFNSEHLFHYHEFLVYPVDL